MMKPKTGAAPIGEDALGEGLIGRRRLLGGLGAAGLAMGAVGLGAGEAAAKSARKIQSEVHEAREEMFRRFPVTRRYYEDAVAVLIIPEIIKAGLVVGGAYGEGLMTRGGEIDSYWSYAAGSIGYQIGVQETNQALFFMTPTALKRFNSADGFEVGADAEITVLDKGAEVAVDTTKDTKPIIVVVFGRGGLMAGASLQGGKYTKIYR